MTDEPGELRRDDAAVMWRTYAAAHPDAVGPGEKPAVERFGDTAALADELLGLVLHGPKRATAGLVLDFRDAAEPLPAIGGHWVACDGAGRPRCVLRSVELRIGPLASVDDAFAWDEGEGDRTRASWLEAHERYFRRTLTARGRTWSDDLEVVFERFRVVWPPEVAG
ncbi:ASCH domain-containing protein [Blastococcus sp. VKM Ac-2987]|uniref:ASCH domain-containing protein n=1 Tax=Blastococcus sp. VKM Ac-2987 TaxID=3004141 RepID=UPI0022AB663C|nr:ASCH domain-containing protein [Blastococcus sp. VKM Ac-2987]MCZ2856952.1 ASCH domain-containing protein [Blastococcus sp. VKM Ac-2987]